MSWKYPNICGSLFSIQAKHPFRFSSLLVYIVHNGFRLSRVATVEPFSFSLFSWSLLLSLEALERSCYEGDSSSNWWEKQRGGCARTGRGIIELCKDINYNQKQLFRVHRNSSLYLESPLTESFLSFSKPCALFLSLSSTLVSTSRACPSSPSFLIPPKLYYFPLFVYRNSTFSEEDRA